MRKTRTARKIVKLGPPVVALAMVTSALLPTSARADWFDAKERKARFECSAGNPAEGVRLLAELWVATGDATWLYNQGRCYEQNGQNNLAATRFREYLRKAENLPAMDAEAINLRIKELERQASGRTAPAPTVINLVQPAAPHPIDPAAAKPIVADRSAELFSPSQPPPPAQAPVYKRWWFWTGIGVVVAGGVVTALVISHSAAKSPGCDPGVPCVP